jgi:hypothetical protein
MDSGGVRPAKNNEEFVIDVGTYMTSFFKEVFPINLNAQRVIYYAVSGLLVFGLSYLGFVFPWLNWFVFWVIVVIGLLLALTKLEDAVFLLFFELFLGAKGYLFSFPFGEMVVSLRLALFIVVFIGWAWWIMKYRQRLQLISSPYFLPFSLFVSVLGMGVILGLFHNSPGLIFFDVNGYLYWGLLLVMLTALRDMRSMATLFHLFLGCSVAISLFTIIVFFDFYIFHQDARPTISEAISTELSIDQDGVIDPDKISQSTGAKDELRDSVFRREAPSRSIPLIYRWLQDTGLGEVSYLTGRFFRVFFISQIFPMLAFLMIWAQLIVSTGMTKKERRFLIMLAGLFLTVVIMSLSRSLWIGLAGGVAISIFFVPLRKSIRLVIGGFIAAALCAGALRVVSPPTFDAWSERLVSIVRPGEEGASTNRINLLAPLTDGIGQSPWFGNGFGTTIEYESVTPEKQGTLRVYLSEWTYLDILLKIGVVGLGIYLLLLAVPMVRGVRYVRVRIADVPDNRDVIKQTDLRDYAIKKPARDVIVIGFIIATIGFLVTNLTTPYLNHPLGIGFLVLFITMLSTFEKERHMITHNKRS